MKANNPILPGFHPDPCALRVGRDWYVATSTFEWFPGVEIHHSVDLLHWDLVARPLADVTMLDMADVPNSGGVWAPCLSYDKGLFYLVFSITRTFEETTQDTENYLTWAPTPQGPWAPRVPLHCGGFDASLFHAPDGSKWIVGMRWDSRYEQNHFPGIYLQRYNPQTHCLEGDARLIFSGTALGLTEGPHLYRHDGQYYLMTAEGGTSEGHAVTVCRSHELFGPYEPDPAGPMLTSRYNPECPVQYAGHGSLVEAEDGQWYLFHLGSRKALFNGWSVLGRETFAQNVVWKNGWPRLTSGDALPRETFEVPQTAVVSHAPVSLRFDTPVLPLRMASLRVPADMSLTPRPGWLRLYGRESLLSKHRQTMVGTQADRVPCVCETTVDCSPAHFQQAAGLALWYHTANFYAMLITWDASLGRCLRVIARDSKRTRLLVPMLLLPQTGEVRLRMILGNENVSFAMDAGSGWQSLSTENAPVCILSDEYANRCGEQGFTGCFAVLCCQDQTGGRWHADFNGLSLR